MVGLGRVELPTRSLGNCCSIHLSYSPTRIDYHSGGERIVQADCFSPDTFGPEAWGRGSVQSWSEIERLTDPIGERLLNLVRVNRLEQVAILHFLGRALHGYKPFDFAWQEDPNFEKSLLRPYEEITHLL